MLSYFYVVKRNVLFLQRVGPSVWYHTCFFIMFSVLSVSCSGIRLFFMTWLFLWIAWKCLQGWGLCRYIKDDVVLQKGKVASEISSADELTLTELMLNGTFRNIKVEDMVSLLSCFVWQEKLQDAQKPREELGLLFAQLQDTAQQVAKVQLESKVCVI